MMLNNVNYNVTVAITRIYNFNQIQSVNTDDSPVRTETSVCVSSNVCERQLASVICRPICTSARYEGSQDSYLERYLCNMLLDYFTLPSFRAFLT